MHVNQKELLQRKAAESHGRARRTKRWKAESEERNPKRLPKARRAPERRQESGDA